MPLVTMRIMEGRDINKKRNMVKKVTEAICETLDCPEDAVRISIEEMAAENYSIGGTLIADKK